MKKFFVFGLSLALLVACLAGCAASPRAENAASDKGYYEGVYDSVESTEAERPGENAAGLQNQKLIRTVSVEAETDDLDASLSTLASRISAMGGYVEDQTIRSNASGSRYASMTIRVPVDQMDSFVTYIRDQSNVTYYTESAEDVTLQYVATESRIAALETERERLMDLMAKAEDMSDLLMIEQRLTDVLTELEQVQSQLRVYDNLVDYGTIHLSLSQVKEYTPVEEQDVWQRIGSGFMDGLENLGNGCVELFVMIVVAIPYLIPIGLISVVIILVVRNHRKKKAQKEKEEKAE